MNAKHAALISSLKNENDVEVTYIRILKKISDVAFEGEKRTLTYTPKQSILVHVPKLIKRLEQLGYEVEFHQNMKYFSDYLSIKF
jgi:hypothetical protein